MDKVWLRLWGGIPATTAALPTVIIRQVLRNTDGVPVEKARQHVNWY